MSETSDTTTNGNANNAGNGSGNDNEGGDWLSASVTRNPGEHATVIDSEQVADDPETALTVAKIKALRQSIDNVDTAIVSLLAERFKYTSQVGVLKARAGFAPADYKREDYQIERLHRIAVGAGLDPDIAEMYREFVVTEAKKRHQRIADAGGDPGVLDVFA
ncbi:chorismate mutase [Bifidobacterium sp. UTCIF-37]|uniref:chorismate mutase n=1 Tax=unclassified Bifidobacterium TaxID=2608897 RepID=UPI00215900E1|nr:MULTISPECIES: chorismate mutase [unclassified Bifidobacterium]TPF86027.1 chorismate mutase [Bifidobacterium sp. UTCIF-37]TPF88248.1 chorismate mutase [Bifidobacterium sp. UTCIF-38]